MSKKDLALLLFDFMTKEIAAGIGQKMLIRKECK